MDRAALEWLNATLVSLTGAFEAGLVGEIAREWFWSWPEVPDLESVRSESALQALPPLEADAWRMFWRDVQALQEKYK